MTSESPRPHEENAVPSMSEPSRRASAVEGGLIRREREEQGGEKGEKLPLM